MTRAMRLTPTPLLVTTALLAALAASCDDDTIQVVNNTPVDASLTARIVSYPRGEAMAGAEYELVGTGRSGSADSRGVIDLDGLALGTYELRVTAPGHAATRLSFEVAAGRESAGPIHLHKNIVLLEKSAALDLHLYAGLDGGPARRASIDLDFAFPDGVADQEVDDPEVPRLVAADSAGAVSLRGLPASKALVSVRPYDVNGDGTPDYRTTAAQVDLVPGAAVAASVVLDADDRAVRVVQSNLPPYGATLRERTLFLIFSAEMDTAAAARTELSATNYPYEQVPLSWRWTSPVRLEVEPRQRLVETDGGYRLAVAARARSGLVFSSSWQLLWILDLGAGGGDCAQVVTDLALSPSNEPVDYDTRSLELQWTAVPCAGGYALFARDDRANRAWVFLREEANDYDVGTVTTIVTLPASFDRYRIDGVQTPFAGIRVTFCVVPREATAPDPGGSHGALEVADSVPPAVPELAQTGQGINPGGTPTALEFWTDFGEFVGAAVPDPTLEIVEAGGDPGFTLDPAAASWIWDAGRVRGRFVFALGAGRNATGDRLRLRIEDLGDLSGNIRRGTSVTPWLTIETGSRRFDFERSAQGWTQAGPGWAWGTPQIGPRGGHSGTGCWGTTLIGSYGSNWNTSLTSPEITVPPGSPVLSFWCWFSTEYVADRCLVGIDEQGVFYSLDTLQGYSNGWVLRTYPIPSYAGHLVRIQFNFQSDSQTNYDGFFVDDVEVEGTGR